MLAGILTTTLKGKLGSLFQNRRHRPSPDADLALLDPWEVRTHSIKQVEKLGYPTNPNLPLLDKPAHSRPEDEVFGRMMCVFITSACAYGVNKADGLGWLEREGFSAAMTPQELEFLEAEEADGTLFQNRVEALYVLAWSLGYVRRLNYSERSDDDFVHLFPNVKTGQTATLMRAKAKPRSIGQVFSNLDLAFCLDWAIEDAKKNQRRIPGEVHPTVIYQRHWALEWLLGDGEWTDSKDRSG